MKLKQQLASNFIHVSLSEPANFDLLQKTEALAIASGNTTGLALQIGKKTDIRIAQTLFAP